MPVPERRLRVRRLLAISAVVGAAILPASAAHATPLASQPASSYRDSIGVQTHFPFPGFAYDKATTAELATMLRTLGITHLRDDTCFLAKEPDCARVRTRLAELRGAFGTSGPKVDLLALYSRELSSVPNRAVRDADIARALTAAASPPLAGMVAALEPVNEPDLKESTDWASATIADNDTYRRLMAQPQYASLRGLPHLSPAIGHAKNTALLLARGWNASRATIGNFHPYPPVWGTPEIALDTACGTGTALTCVRQLGASATPWATEVGYSTSGTGIATNWVSERAQAVYLPRLLLENFRRGVSRTYLYELLDLRQDFKPLIGSAVDGFGLYRSRVTTSGYYPAGPKPAALALSRMNTTIGDLGAGRAAAATLDVTVGNAGKVVDDSVVRRVLLRRADGSYVLALWQPKPVWRNTVWKQADLNVPELTAQVSITGGPWNATASRPTFGTATTGSWANAQQLTLPIGADVTLIDLQRVGGNEPGSAGGPRDPWAAAQAALAQAAWAWWTSLF
ncbi:MAG: hypothetical protein J7513_00885 [Solirubrobacteraceae bacterium]|nr:hypothetical protein [Solirubrobacteraceae bacterium]